MPKRTKTHKEFIKEVYDLVEHEFEVLGEYKTAKTKIKTKHIKCGHEFDMTPDSFLRGSRCPKCQQKKVSKAQTKTRKQFVEEVYDLVGNEFEVLGEYKTARIKILMKHNICGNEFEIMPHSFLYGNRCTKCRGHKLSEEFRKTRKQFLKEVYDLTKDEYEVLGEYKNTNTNIKMKHNECGYEYEVKPYNFLSGKRCPKCRDSKGEKAIADWLSKNHIEHQRQYRLEDCLYERVLPFDLAVFHNDKLLALIEYQGIQHFEPVEHWGGEKALIGVQKRDKIKAEYCKKNNIPLIIIPYWNFDNINYKLNTSISQLLTDKTKEA